MFGSHGRLERKLRKQGKAALATVLSADVTVPAISMSSRTNLGPLQRDKVSNPRWKMTVRVEPDGEPPFDAEIHGWLEERPSVVHVLYDPSDHRKVLFDESAYKARQAATQAVRALTEQHKQSSGFGRVVSAADLLASGQRVPGVLQSFTATGSTPRSRGFTDSTFSRPELLDAPDYWLNVELQIPDMGPLISEHIQPVPPAHVPNLASGLKLPCVVDPANPLERFFVDWDAIAH